ncbi:hypothetical protein PTD2_20997 [Pseudoalteromonas tunicata D2]|uniref:Uncharacterized protein n=1 Tax=Pseudoalteromonas tunicata D2 TaxID=87626 RepID=A4CAC5_9GAMM|nr:hypothetical protein PTD2_20997 [Pseudoalteromonas tunicata D2]
MISEFALRGAGASLLAKSSAALPHFVGRALARQDISQQTYWQFFCSVKFQFQALICQKMNFFKSMRTLIEQK